MRSLWSLKFFSVLFQEVIHSPKNVWGWFVFDWKPKNHQILTHSSYIRNFEWLSWGWDKRKFFENKKSKMAHSKKLSFSEILREYICIWIWVVILVGRNLKSRHLLFLPNQKVRSWKLSTQHVAKHETNLSLHTKRQKPIWPTTCKTAVSQKKSTKTRVGFIY